MLKTNCKIVNERIKLFIQECYNFEAENDYEIIEKSNGFADICKNIITVFEAEKRYNKPANADLFSDWLSGLPHIFDGYYYYSCSRPSAAEILANMLEYTEDEKKKYCSDNLKCCQFLDWLIYRTISRYNK